MTISHAAWNTSGRKWVRFAFDAASFSLDLVLDSVKRRGDKEW